MAFGVNDCGIQGITTRLPISSKNNNVVYCMQCIIKYYYVVRTGGCNCPEFEGNLLQAAGQLRMRLYFTLLFFPLIHIGGNNQKFWATVTVISLPFFLASLFFCYTKSNKILGTNKV